MSEIWTFSLFLTPYCVSQVSTYDALHWRLTAYEIRLDCNQEAVAATSSTDASARTRQLLKLAKQANAKVSRASRAGAACV